MPTTTVEDISGLQASRQTDAATSGAPNMTAFSSFSLVNGRSNSSDTNGFSSSADLERDEVEKQLEALKAQLEVENRVKDGAENLLNVPTLPDELRHQVESELATARKKITAMVEQIKTLSVHCSRQKTNGATPVTGKRRIIGLAPSISAKHREGSRDDKDDFHTALNHALNCIKSLASTARSTTTSATTSPSSSSSHSPSTSPTDISRTRIEIMNRLVGILQRNLRVRYELDIAELVQAVLPGLSDRSSKHCRASAYRLLRHALIDSDSVERLREQPLDWYIVKSLARDNKHAVEKEQVIKLIRTIVAVGSERRGLHGAAGSGTVPISEPVMRAFIAVADYAEDPFRPICIQTLAEILLIDIDLVARTDGIRFLLHALGEGPTEMGPILAATFLYIVDSPRTRCYLSVGTDLEMAISAVTDAYGKGPDHTEKMRGCARVIQLMLRTWSGLMYFCMGNMLAIRSIVDTLRIPSLGTREIIIDMFFELLNIKTPEWFQTFIDGRRLTMYRRSRLLSGSKTDTQASERPHEALKLTDQYIALLVLVFTNAGLLDALTAMLEETTTGSNLSRKATLLLAEVLQMANRVLPLSVAAKIQAVPRIFNLASDYSEGEHRIIGTSALSAIDSYNRNRFRLQPTAAKNFRPRANSAEDAVRRGQRQVEQVKIKMGMQMDDKTFQSALLETQVMLTKDHTKWNFEVLQDLIEGPLLNPKRMEEAIKVSRFIRRLLSFFHPFSHRFSDMEKDKANHRWVKLGCSLMSTLIASPDGIRFLSTEDPLLKQLTKSFAQLDPFNGTPPNDPIFSEVRFVSTLTYGYLEMLGTLSMYKEGVELMEQFKVFTALYHICELRSREDLVKGIIQNLNYSFDGHSRIVLSKVLTSTYKNIRLFATNHLGELIRQSPHANAWTLRLLLTQLYDTCTEVCEVTVHFLEEACESMEILQLVVEMQPTVDHLGEIGHPLLLKFMSTAMGFRYLFDAGYIDREMDMWLNERNIIYVIQVEIFLAKVFGYSSPSDEDLDILAFDGIVPPHFYGEMSKTELGCQVLQEKGHFVEFALFIRRHGLESADPELILKLKSILWAVGNIGATDGGLPFLEEEEIIPAILDIAEQSPIPSVRGTCFFVLGLISSTSQGAEILDDYHWEATLSPLGTPTGLCIPVDVEKFVSMPPWNPPPVTDDPESRLLSPTTQTELEVITAIQNLGNTVIANAASRSLTRMKSRPEYRPVFSSPSTFYRALHTISTQRYRLPVRRYILDLFNIELDTDVVKSLTDCAKSLRAPPSYKQLKSPSTRVVSMFGRLGRSRRVSDSDDDDDVSDTAENDTIVIDEKPVVALRPVSRIIGFDS